MATFVLIHGTFQGGWIWKSAGEQLQSAGHRIYRPTLDGCAERALTLRPEITATTWGTEIARLIFFEDLREVILVGTSIGGLAVGHAAQEIPERIRRIVLIDALLPVPGETLAQIGNRPPYDPSQLTYGGDHAFASIEPEKLQAWAKARYTPQPRIPADGPMDLRKFWSMSWKADVLRCSRHASPPEAHQRRNAERLGARYSTLDSGHYPMLTHVDEIANYLHERSLD